MRHLLVTNDFPPKFGGIQSYLWELWRRLPPDSFAVYTTPHRGAAEFDFEPPRRHGHDTVSARTRQAGRVYVVEDGDYLRLREVSLTAMEASLRATIRFDVVAREGGHVERAATKLGISRSSLYAKLKGWQHRNS